MNRKLAFLPLPLCPIDINVIECVVQFDEIFVSAGNSVLAFCLCNAFLSFYSIVACAHAKKQGCRRQSIYAMPFWNDLLCALFLVGEGGGGSAGVNLFKWMRRREIKAETEYVSI